MRGTTFRPSRQRGAIAMMTAFFLLLGIICLVLVVDTGRLYFEQRRLQGIADTTALDTATQGGLCSMSDGPSLLDLATASAARNGYDDDLAAMPNQVQGGYLQTVDGIRVFTADTMRPEAVHIVLGRSVPASLVAGGLFGGTVNLQVQATAQRVPIATFSAGSKLLNINTQKSALLNPLLNGLLGTHLNLDAVSYQDVVNADVSVLEILQSAGLLSGRITAASVDEALSTNISVGNFINSTLNVLDEKQVAGVGLMRSQLLGISNATIKLADILALDSTPGLAQEALKAKVNVLEVLLAAAMASNKNSVTLDLGLAGITAKLRVIEPPQIAVGLPGREGGEWRTRARTAQIQLTVGANSNVLGLIAADLGLSVNVAQGDAWFEQARCRTLATGSTGIDLGGQTGLASIVLTNSSGGGQAKVQVGVLSIPLVRADVSLNTTIGASSVRDIEYDIANKREELPEMKTISSGNGIATSVNNLGVTVTYPLVINFGLVTNAVKDLVVNALVNNLVNPLVVPLLALLGIEPGVMDVMLIDVREGPAVLAG